MQKKIDISWLLQLSYLLLFETGTACALWQKGDTNFTFAVLAIAPLLMLLSRIPFRFFPGIIRQIIQLVLAGLALAWFQQRAMQAPLDIALIECAAVIAVSLLLSGRMREHGMLALLSFAFAGYGGLTPGRPIYFPAFLITCAIYVIIMYQTRTLVYVRLGTSVPFIQPHFWGNWLYRIMHFAIVIAIAVYCMLHFPIRKKMHTIGVAPVSFHSEQDMEFPQLWSDWFAPTHKLLTSEKVSETTDSNESDDEPKAPSNDAKALTHDTSMDTMNAQEGDGGSAASIGTDLVFRAYSTAKLYWVMQIYDIYDGKLWTRSKTLVNGTSELDKFRPNKEYEVVQHITVSKLPTTRVPYAFKPQNAVFRNRFTQYSGDQNKAMAVLKHPDAITFELRSRTFPPFPWNYRVQSFIPAPDCVKTPPPWNEPPRNYGWTYKSLPQEIISQRVRSLTEKLTKGIDDPKHKADILRDYLRNNYKYNTKVRGVPEGREVVDYFLFESQEGYCQHFAQALVVMARLAGLPARLVTGYSPGKYNVLANCFEVYEYHAHAWTQIFIEPYGWLTYDGVAPGDLQLGDNKNILNSMLDPFGDEWKATPPELSFQPPPQEKAVHSGDENRKTSDPVASRQEKVQESMGDMIDEIMDRATNQGKKDPTFNDFVKATKSVLGEKLKEGTASVAQKLHAKLAELYEKSMYWLKATWSRFLAQGWFLITIECTAFVLISWIWRKRRYIARLCIKYWRLVKCNLLWRRINSGKMDRSHQVSSCQKLINEILQLSGFRRPADCDILECAELFTGPSACLKEDYLTVANIACNNWFGKHKPSPKDAKEALEATRRFRKAIRKNCK